MVGCFRLSGIYVAILGRFLSVDPIAGGNANDYNYPNDPINSNDLTGQMIWIDGIGSRQASVASIKWAASHKNAGSAWVYNHRNDAANARAAAKKAAAADKSEADGWATFGIVLGVIALAALIVVAAPIALPALAVTAITVAGVAAGATGAVIDGTQCFQHKDSLGCAGMIFDTAATGFGVGGYFIPGEMAAGYGVVTAPYAVTGLGIDTTIGVNQLSHH